MKGRKKVMATSKKTVTKKAGTKTAAKKAAPAKVGTKKTAAAKKAVTKKAAVDQPAIKKGSKFACQVCGFAITVDRVCGCIEEAYLVCCETPMKHKRPSVKKK
jgi:hypothetical protein